MKSICFLSLFKYRMQTKLYYNYLSMSKKEKMRPKSKPQSDSEPEAEAEKEQAEQEFSLYALLQVDKKASKDEIVLMTLSRKNSTESWCFSTTPTRTKKTLTLVKPSRNSNRPTIF